MFDHNLQRLNVKGHCLKRPDSEMASIYDWYCFICGHVLLEADLTNPEMMTCDEVQDDHEDMFEVTNILEGLRGSAQ